MLIAIIKLVSSSAVYGPLLSGATTVLFEGKPVGTPDAGTFWRVIQQHKVCKRAHARTQAHARAQAHMQHTQRIHNTIMDQKILRNDCHDNLSLQVKGLFCAPTAIRAIRKEDPDGRLIRKYDLGASFKKLFLAGERADADTINWAASHLKVPVIGMIS